ILANAGGVTVSYFEWVQNREGYVWSEDVVNSRLREVMIQAFTNVLQYSRLRRVNMRTAAYMLSIDRVAAVHRMRCLSASGDEPVRVTVIAVGRPDRLFAGVIAEYERRAARYWDLESVEVRAERAAGGKSPAAVRAAEGERLLARVPEGVEIVALTRTGQGWSSPRLAQYLEGLAVSGRPGAAFLIGGAYGLDDAVLRRAHHRLAL